MTLWRCWWRSFPGERLPVLTVLSYSFSTSFPYREGQCVSGRTLTFRGSLRLPWWQPGSCSAWLPWGLRLRHFPFQTPLISVSASDTHRSRFPLFQPTPSILPFLFLQLCWSMVLTQGTAPTYCAQCDEFGRVQTPVALSPWPRGWTLLCLPELLCHSLCCRFPVVTTLNMRSSHLANLEAHRPCCHLSWTAGLGHVCPAWPLMADSPAPLTSTLRSSLGV